MSAGGPLKALKQPEKHLEGTLEPRSAKRFQT